MPDLPRRDACLAMLGFGLPPLAWSQGEGVRLWPAHGATNVNPDTPLTLSFPSAPTLGTAGQIRIYDAADQSLVDTLDMSIPAGPDWRRRRPKGSPPDTTVYQEKTYGGVAGIHFFPVIVRGQVATVTLHQALRYGRSYVVQIDPGVIGGLAEKLEWRFSTKPAAPPAHATWLVVAADGSADFSSVQGAVDFVPAEPRQPVTIFIRNGHFEELVHVRGKSRLTLRGESRDGVVLAYGNNSAFNPSKPRYAFTVADCRAVQLSNFTINNLFHGQAEALMIDGREIVVDRMTLNGSGDALQLRGQVYLSELRLSGHGDTILSTAAAFFERCEIRSHGPFIWPRNTAASHGLVFKDCSFIAVDEPLPWARPPEAGSPSPRPKPVLARIPDNGGVNYPHAEVVLLGCRLDGVSPEAWTVQPPPWDSSKVRFWEFNSTDLQGRPLDVSLRHPVSRQLSEPADAATIADYSRPAFVLAGWEPALAARPVDRPSRRPGSAGALGLRHPVPQDLPHRLQAARQVGQAAEFDAALFG